MQFGLLLPHFGEHASRENVLDGAARAESLGFDSVFVRDHLLFEPHGTMENADPTFYDALTTLTAIGVVTQTITLGTGALIPYRNPVHLARVLATMTTLLGERLLLGIGAGRFGREFEIAGVEGSGGLPLVETYIDTLRTLATQSDATVRIGNNAFDHITVNPQPGRVTPIWYCGSSPASARFAVEHCQGWMPGRITLATIRQQRDVMQRRAADRGRPVPAIGVIAPTSIAADTETAMASVNLDGLLAWANQMGKWWVKPQSGRFETAADIEGSLIAGDPDAVVTEVRKFADSGVQHLVFDLRAGFDRWNESLELLGKEVLPRIRSES